MCLCHAPTRALPLVKRLDHGQRGSHVVGHLLHVSDRHAAAQGASEILRSRNGPKTKPAPTVAMHTGTHSPKSHLTHRLTCSASRASSGCDTVNPGRPFFRMPAFSRAIFCAHIRQKDSGDSKQQLS